mmetsp:Transcript_94235/g.243414  ORF Transcript_94235/g.243414 Transcript_94235/m.243414 type:complete len:227 (+) Transcript_94235:485-1165(+)
MCAVIRVAKVPEEAVILLGARLQGGALLPCATGAGVALEVQAPAARLLLQHEDLRWDHAAVHVDLLESLQEPRERSAALQLVAHLAEGAQVTVPRQPVRARPAVGEVRVLQQLLREVAIPRIDSAGTVALRVANHLVPRARLRPGVAPHVRHLRARCHHDLAAAEPDAQRLVQILATPAQHLPIVTAGLHPPPAGHAQQAAGDDRDVVIVGVHPLEVGVPREVALR